MPNLESLEKICNDFPHYSIYMTATIQTNNENYLQTYRPFFHSSSFIAVFIMQKR